MGYMERLKWKSDDKFTKVHLIITQCLQDDFGRFKTDQAIMNLVKVKKQKWNKESKKLM